MLLDALHASLEKLPEVTIAATKPLGVLAETIDVVAKKTEPAKIALQTFSENSGKSITQLNQVAVRALGGVENAIMGLSDRTTTLKDSFRSMAISIAQDLQRMLIKKTITGPLGGLLDTALGSLGSLFGGGAAPVGMTRHFAKGGNIRANELAVVGEKGPELFMPRTGGKVIANKDISGGGVTIHNSFDFSNANPATVALLQDQAERIKQETFNEVFNSIGKGGRFARIVGRRT